MKELLLDFTSTKITKASKKIEEMNQSMDWKYIKYIIESCTTPKKINRKNKDNNNNIKTTTQETTIHKTTEKENKEEMERE